MSNTFLEIKNLNVIYKTDLETVYALNDVSLELEKGQTLGLVGETGAGKTTLALSILGLLPERVGHITGGQILFDGEDMAQMSEDDLCKARGNRISMIFQDPMSSLNPVIQVGEQIREAVALHMDLSKEEQEEHVDKMLEMVGIPASRKHEFPHQFSGGMKQRVMIAMALACSPELLIADEPTTALDVTIQAQILRMMAELKKSLNTSMIFISHDLAVVSEICDKVAVIYAGEILESGTIREVYSPGAHHPYTEGLFDSIPSLTENVSRLSPIDGLMPDPTALPEGCSFSPRCPHCTQACGQQDPGLTEISPGHQVKCLLFQREEG